MSYENPWRFNGEIFESSDIQDYFGFVYHIHCNETNRSYIGRKYFWSFRKQGGKSRRTKMESDWKSITDPAQSSRSILTFGENHLATEEYLASIRQKDNVTTKKPDNYS